MEPARRMLNLCGFRFQLLVLSLVLIHLNGLVAWKLELDSDSPGSMIQSLTVDQDSRVQSLN